MWTNKKIGVEKAQNVFVAVFDIVGFKKIMDDEGTQEVHKKLKLLQAIAYNAMATTYLDVPGKKNTKKPDPLKLRGNLALFSDTILFSTHADSPVDFINLLMFTANFLQGTIVAAKIPIRGGIGYGDIVWEPRSQKALGSAIIDAYINEQSLASLGCLVSENFIKKVKAPYIYKFLNLDFPGLEKVKKRIVELDNVPLQRNTPQGKDYYEEKRWVINWFDDHLSEDISGTVFPSSIKKHHLKLKNNSNMLERMIRNRE